MDKNNTTFNDFQLGEVILVNKYIKWTSFDVVNKLRYLLKSHLGIKKIKVGHAGTLDPLATGLVIICTGKKTKEIEQYQAQEKEYIADIYIGATTPSFDLETEIDNEYEINHITKESIEETLKKFIGKQQQIPPVFSAKKINGKRAYISARKSIDVKMKPSDIEILDINILKINLPHELQIKIKCSKGTYIRALARDIGIALNSGAYLRGLIRTKIGNFSIDNSITVDEFENLL